MKAFLNHWYRSKIVFSLQLKTMADKQESTATTAYRILMEHSLNTFLMQCLMWGCTLPRLYTNYAFEVKTAIRLGSKAQRTLVKDKCVPHLLGYSAY
jgi:hypothetical protein